MSDLSINQAKVSMAERATVQPEQQRILAQLALNAQSVAELPADYEPDSRTPVLTHLLKKAGELSL